MIDPKRAYTARSAAEATDLDERTIRRAVRVGELPATRSGRLHVIGGGDLARWFAARPTAAAVPPIVEVDPHPVTAVDQVEAIFERLYLAERQRAEDLAREAAGWRARAEVAEERAIAAERQLAQLPATTSTTAPASPPTPQTGGGWFARRRRRGA